MHARMTRSLLHTILAALFLFAGRSAMASTARAQMTIVGNAIPTVTVTFTGGTGSISGLNTAAASQALGTFGAHTAAPTGLNLSRAAAHWGVEGSITVKVDKLNLTSPSYTLMARLATAPAAGVAWRVNATELSTTDSTLTATGTYGVGVARPWILIIQNSAAPGSINNTIHFTAVSN